jgi:hypothetical protein
LNIPRAAVDERCGFAERYASKLLSPVPQKRIGVGSMLALISALGHEIHLIPNPQAIAEMREQVTPRKLRAGVLAVKNGRGKDTMVSKRFLKKIARLGGQARALRMNPSWRKGVARRAALARWAKAKATQHG